MTTRETIERDALDSIRQLLTSALPGSVLAEQIATCGSLERALQRQTNLVKRAVDSCMPTGSTLMHVQPGSIGEMALKQRVVDLCLERVAMPRFQVTTTWTGNYDTVTRANSRSADVLEAIERLAMGEVTSVDLDQDLPTQLRLVAV